MEQNKSENNVEFDNMSEKVLSTDNLIDSFNKTASKSDDLKIINNFKDYTAAGF